MQTKKKLILLSALTFGFTYSAFAQDVIVDFKKEGLLTGVIETIAKDDNVDFTFSGDNTGKLGVYINGSMPSAYYLSISSSKDIAVIEYEVVIPGSGKTDNVIVTAGSAPTVAADGTRIWRGPAKNVKFTGATKNDNFRITRLRLWHNADDYDPATATWEDNVGGGDSSSDVDYSLYDMDHDDTDYSNVVRHYAMPKSAPTDGKPVPMAVVAAPMYRDALQPYLEWKTQQGYEVHEIYVDALTGNREKDTEALRQKLIAMEPQPSYVLLVGDENQVPVFWGHKFKKTHAADFYYGEFTGDFFADAYVGRFPVSNVSQLDDIMAKTRYMAFINPADGGWLKRSLTVDGVKNIAPELSVMSGSLDFAQKYFRNYEDNVVFGTTPSAVSTINTNINNGCSFVTYMGHGMNSSWSGGYSTNNVSGLANDKKYPVIMSLTCLTGYFDLPGDCLAEAFMRGSNKGAVAVLAASTESYPTPNHVLYSGSKYKGYEHLGFIRSLFPMHGDDPSQRARTIGMAKHMGNFGVYGYNIEEHYIGAEEMYNLFGDPTYQPYITTPKQMRLISSNANPVAGRSFNVRTVPNAMVCLSRGRDIIATGVADRDGRITLHIPATTAAGNAVLYSSAMGYNDAARNLNISGGNGTEEVTNEAVAIARVTVEDVITMESANVKADANWPSSSTAFGVTSAARYKILAATEEAEKKLVRWDNPDERSMYFRNRHDPCGLVTTVSPGKVRTVSVDYRNIGGLPEVIGVYGKNSAYNETSDAKLNPGKKLGEIRKDSPTLTIDDDYSFVALRVEDTTDTPMEQHDVLLRSITIGWEANLPPCAKPEIAFEDGKFHFNCTTEGATYNYGVAPAQGEKDKFVLTVTAEADGFKPSEAATLTIDASKLAKLSGDVDENGTLSITDVVKLINSLTSKK